MTRLPHRIVVQTESRITFSGGAYTTSWVTASTEWANCQPVSVSNDVLYDKKQQFTKWRVTTKKLNITNANRIIYNSKILIIEGTSDPSNRNKFLEIICREEVE
jgi:SPP1 family predicted phage head-tail adaptor